MMIRLVVFAILMLLLGRAASASPLSDASTGADYLAVGRAGQLQYVDTLTARVFPGASGDDWNARAGAFDGCLSRKLDGVLSRNEEEAKRNLERPLASLTSECTAEIRADMEEERRDQDRARALFTPSTLFGAYARASEEVRIKYGEIAANRARLLGQASEAETDLATHITDCLDERAGAGPADRLPQRLQQTPLHRLSAECLSSYRSSAQLSDFSTGADYLRADSQRQAEYITATVRRMAGAGTQIQLAAASVFVDRCLQNALKGVSRRDQKAAEKLRGTELESLVRTCLVMRELGR